MNVNNKQTEQPTNHVHHRLSLMHMLVGWKKLCRLQDDIFFCLGKEDLECH